VRPARAPLTLRGMGLRVAFSTMGDAAAPLLLKLSGEVLAGAGAAAFDQTVLTRVCDEIAAAVAAGRRLALVVGGGNILRGADIDGMMLDPTAGHHMGMLATLINALAVRDGLRRAGCAAEVFAPHDVPQVARAFSRDAALRVLDAGGVAIFGGGTGHPFLTTDTTAALRAAEIGAACLLKGSKVDGVYSADPRTDPDARRLERLGFDEALAGAYGVMDQAAFALCRERRVPIRVFKMTAPGAITAALGDDPPGTLVGDPAR